MRCQIMDGNTYAAYTRIAVNERTKERISQQINNTYVTYGGSNLNIDMDL